MINGLDPIIIFHIYDKPKTSAFRPLQKYEQRLYELRSAVGIPIVIPLSEKLTGLYIDNESRSLTTATSIDPNTEKDPETGLTEGPEVYQTAIESTVNVSMKAIEGSIMLTVFLSVAELLLSKLVSGEYGITYFHKSTVIFNGLLSSLNTSVIYGTDLLKIDFSISTAKQKLPTLPKAKVEPVGPTPISRVEGPRVGPQTGT